jgi:hypothetical protein
MRGVGQQRDASMTDEVICESCGKAHPRGDIELTFQYPDEIFELSDTAKEARCKLNGDIVILDDSRFFIRGLLPLDVSHRTQPYCLGIWAEVTEQVFARISELWDDPRQEQEPPMPGMLANTVPFHERTAGLALTIELTGTKTRPQFFLDPIDHSLYIEQLVGIDEHRAFQYSDRTSRKAAAVQQALVADARKPSRG